ncbi:MAG: response regulator [Terriglobales bacterium]
MDDEEGIRMTLPAILCMHGFEVVTASTVAEALDILNRESFDVLLADLNIGQPGDGFTVVSAMRRTQPQAVTIIITGFPAFETALEAIRQQVDDYVVKPANVEQLVRMIKARLEANPPRALRPLHRVATLLREQERELVEEWLFLVNADPELAAIPLSREERADHVPAVIVELIETLDQHRGVVSDAALKAAELHGHERRRQHYSLALLMQEARYLRRAILLSIQNHLLEVNISYLLTDLIELSDSLDMQVRRSVEGFLGEIAGKAA